MIAIIDYGVGNLFSLKSSFDKIGQKTIVTGEIEEIKKADKIILPGVGAFEDAAKKLRESGLFDIVIEEAEDNGDGLNFLAGKSMSFVNEKAFEGTILAHVDGGAPNLVINVDKADEENLGRLIYFFEKACAISGYVLKVNPFDQPGVERICLLFSVSPVMRNFKRSF